MIEGTPSRTAWAVALRRAAHQVLDTPKVLDDPLALRIVGADHDASRLGRAADDNRLSNALRAFMAVRSRVAEDELARAVDHGVRQYVVLGAGLDTFAYRNPFADRVRVFEVDHPATQAWKRELLARANIEIPAGVTYVAVDFERQDPFERLADAGLNRSQPAFFSWLGVTMYLADDIVFGVLKTIAGMGVSSGVVFDYAISKKRLGIVERMVFEAFAARVARAGEPWTTFFDPEESTERLRSAGFSDVRDMGPEALNARYFSGRTDDLRVGTLAHLAAATV